MRLSNLMLEITRKCNLKCEHCCRGNAQNKNMDCSTVYNAISKAEGITTLSLTGGEPSLYPKGIRDAGDAIRYGNTEVSQMFMVTNAKRVTQEFLSALSHLNGALCDDPEFANIDVSGDQYHPRPSKNGIRKLEEWTMENAGKYINPEDALGRRGNIHSCIGMGRAYWNGLGCREEVLYPYRIEANYIEGDFYVAFNGDVYPSCNLSFHWMKQFRDRWCMGNVNEESWNYEEASERYNEMFMRRAKDNQYEINEERG